MLLSVPGYVIGSIWWIAVSTRPSEQLRRTLLGLWFPAAPPLVAVGLALVTNGHDDESALAFLAASGVALLVTAAATVGSLVLLARVQDTGRTAAPVSRPASAGSSADPG